MEFVLIFLSLLQIIQAYPTEYNSEMSFKRLESGESSGEIVNQCCQREPKYVTVGHGISEGEVRIDVGQCRQKCLLPMVKPLRREEFDKYLRDYPDVDPIQIFLSLQTKQSTLGDSPASSTSIEANEKSISASCLQSTCLPTMTKREIYYDLTGEVKEIDVIEACECISLPQRSCQRIHSLVRVHVDTPFEKEVDLGQCLGSCDDDFSSDHCITCRAVRNKTISVEGPNGAHCLSMIDECQCVGECFRIRQFLKVFDYTHIFDTMNAINSTNNSNIINDVNNETNIFPNHNAQSDQPDGIGAVGGSASFDPFTKVIDIGRCSGSCSCGDVPVASKCLFWSHPNNGTCLSYLSGGRSKCTSTKFVSHFYTDKHGKKHTVVSVTGCGCQ